jgi:hypothetical protein
METLNLVDEKIKFTYARVIHEHPLGYERDHHYHVYEIRHNGRRLNSLGNNHTQWIDLASGDIVEVLLQEDLFP